MSTFRTRRRACQETLLRAGILPRDDYVIEAPATLEGGHAAVERLLRLDPRPDALFCFSDDLAAGAMQACVDHNLRIPEDLALVGYPDLKYARTLRVPLTTVRQPCDLIGQTAARALVDRLENADIVPQQHVIPVELVLRESA